MDALDVTPSTVGTAQPALSCPRCKKPVLQDPAALVAKEKTGVASTACPTCKRQPPANPRAIGCLHCGRRIFASSALNGQTVSCLWCTQGIPIPVQSEDNILKASAKAFKWVVFRDHAQLRQFENKDELVAAMHSGEVLPDDVCMVHRIAEPMSLRKACSKDGSLQSLFDPIGAKASQVGGVVFVVCAALYLIADFYVFGWRQSIIFVTAIVCVTALKQRFWIGIIALFVLGRVLGVPVGGGTFLSLLVEAFFTALVGGIGGGIAYGVTHLIGKIRGWNDRAAVWRALIIVAGFSVVGAIACTPRPPLTDCSQLTKAPDMYVGRQVVFFGSMSGFNMNVNPGGSETLNSWDCKTRDGQSVPGGAFGVASSDATWSISAGKSDSFKTLFRVSGVVKGAGTIGTGASRSTAPLLRKVKIELATEGQ